MLLALTLKSNQFKFCDGWCMIINIFPCTLLLEVTAHNSFKLCSLNLYPCDLKRFIGNEAAIKQLI